LLNDVNEMLGYWNMKGGTPWRTCFRRGCGLLRKRETTEWKIILHLLPCDKYLWTMVIPHVTKVKVKAFNPLAYTDVPETAGLARSINP